MAVSPVILKTNPHRPVDFKESSVLKVLEESGNLNLEVKEDGCQLNMVVEYDHDGAHVFFLSREGKMFNGLEDLGARLSTDERWSKFFNPHIDAGLFRANGGFLLQAEVLVVDEANYLKPCAEISGDLRRMEAIPTDRLRVIVYDVIPLDAVLNGGGDRPYEVFQEVRRMHAHVQVEALKVRFPEIHWALVESVQVFSLAQLCAVYEEFRKRGKEGGVAKDPLCYWKRGKKTGQWKIKPDDECDGVITGLVWGTPGLANDGRVIGFTVLSEHGVEVDAGGITEDQKDAFTLCVALGTSDHEHALEVIVSGQWPVARFTCPDVQAKMPNPFKGHAVKITYMERLPSGSYRHPNFDSFRGITDPLIKE